MGSGASSIARLRKALVIKSYNLRKPTETVDDQFRRYSYRDSDGKLYIRIEDVRKCLEMNSNEYSWVDELFRYSFGGEVTAISYKEFIYFLESGKPPTLSPPKIDNNKKSKVQFSPNTQKDPLHLQTTDSSKPGDTSKDGKYGKAPLPKPFPPFPPGKGNNNNNNVVDASSIKIEPASSNDSDNYGDNDPLEDSSMTVHINLSNISEIQLPSSVKLQCPGDNPSGIAGNSNDEETCLTVTIIDKGRGDLQSNSPKPLWRKRETVLQERTVHYTTQEADGSVQELVEKEITKSEVLHMECRDTGEFAHRETTRYEQLEEFNNEVVNEVKGTEEYVHFKSLDDEYHYMESDMPQRQHEQPEAEPELAGGTEPNCEVEQGEWNTDGGQLSPRPTPHRTPPSHEAQEDEVDPELLAAAYAYAEEHFHDLNEDDSARNNNNGCEDGTPGELRNQVSPLSPEDGQVFGDPVQVEEEVSPVKEYTNSPETNIRDDKLANTQQSMHDID